MRKRKGSAAVLLCVLLFSVTAMICVMYEAAERKAAISIAESSFEIAGRSVLACYDKELLNRYGLFGYEIPPDKAGSMLEKMASASLRTTKVAACAVRSVRVEEGTFSLGQQDIFMGQLREAAKEAAVSGIIGSAKEQLNRTQQNLDKEKTASERAQSTEKTGLQRAAEKEKEEAENPDPSIEKKDYTQEYQKMKRNLKRTEDLSRRDPDPGEGKTLANGRVGASLPSISAGLRANAAFSGGSIISDLTETGAGAVGDDAALLAYINGHFRNRNQNNAAEDHFFRAEAEYILFGNLSDEKNYKKAYHAIFAIREAANIAYLYSDSAKRSETLAAAEALAPGPLAPAAQLLIISAWAALESNNDMKNLEHGNGVPMAKSAATWMTDLDTVINGSRGSYIEIPGGSGLNYSRYLDILLLTVDKKTKIYRIMDLIQINMKGAVREDFILADHFTGFTMKAEIQKQSRAGSIPSSSAVITMTHMYRAEDGT